jgi:hypothetical protein
VPIQSIASQLFRSVLQAAQRSVLLFSKEGTHNHWSHDNIQPSKETTCGLASSKKGGKSHDDDKMTLDDDAKVLLGYHHSLSEGG